MAVPALSEPSGDRGRSPRRSGSAPRVGAGPDRCLLHGGGGERHPSLPGRPRDAGRPGGHQWSPVPVDRAASHRRGTANRRIGLHACHPLVAPAESQGAGTRPPAQPVGRLLPAARWAAPREPRRSPHPGALHCDGRPPVPGRGACVRADGAPDSAARRARRVGPREPLRPQPGHWWRDSRPGACRCVLGARERCGAGRQRDEAARRSVLPRAEAARRGWRGTPSSS